MVLLEPDVQRAIKLAAKRLTRRFRSQSFDDYQQMCNEWVLTNPAEVERRRSDTFLLAAHLWRRLYGKAQRWDRAPDGNPFYELRDDDVAVGDREPPDLGLDLDSLWNAAVDYTELEPGDTYTKERVLMLAPCLVEEGEPTVSTGVRVTEGQPRAKSSPAHGHTLWAERVDMLNAWKKVDLTMDERRAFFMVRALDMTQVESAAACGRTRRVFGAALRRAEDKLHAKINGR